MVNLTEKELEMTERHLGYEELMVNKYKAYAENAVDTKIRTKFEQNAARHKNQFESLLKLLK